MNDARHSLSDIMVTMTLKSPRMLAQTFLVLREHRAGMTLEAFADKVGPSVSAVQRYETQNDQIGHRVLYRYQIALGVPNGIILAISHIAAMARDAATLPNEKDRVREVEKLKVMGTYLRNLSDRILRPPGRGKKSLLSYDGVDAKDKESWVPLLLDLILSTQKKFDPDAPTIFEDAKALRALKKVDGERSARAQRRPRSDANGQTPIAVGSEEPSARRMQGVLTQSNSRPKNSRKSGNGRLRDG